MTNANSSSLLGTHSAGSDLAIAIAIPSRSRVHHPIAESRLVLAFQVDDFPLLVRRREALHQIVPTITNRQRRALSRLRSSDTERRSSTRHSPVDSLIPLRPVLPKRPRNRFNKPIKVRIAKVRNTIPGRMDARCCRRLDNSVLRTLDGVVRPPRQKIARIHNDCVLDRRGIHVVTVGRQDLQAACHVLQKQTLSAMRSSRAPKSSHIPSWRAVEQ